MTVLSQGATLNCSQQILKTSRGGRIVQFLVVHHGSARPVFKLDSALRGAYGKGPRLKMFQAPPDWQEKPKVLAGLPCALVSSDQVGDLWTAENWMDSDLGRLNYVREPDVFNCSTMGSTTT